MLNVKRLNELADLIENLPHVDYDNEECYMTDSGKTYGFNMDLYTHACGSPACIAGWAEHLYKEEAGMALGLYDPERRRYVVREPCRRLFYPKLENYEKITPEHAAFTLRHLAKTGEIDWQAYYRSMERE